jgi:hypothetical protein
VAVTSRGRPLIIDLEASGLSSKSYPIEVGIAADDNSKYCALILPAEDWTYWDSEAEKVHRIGRDLLHAHGKPARVIAEDLNRLYAGKTLYTDGWVVDKPWMVQLFHAAGVEMKFTVSPLEMILSEAQMERWHETKNQLLAEVNQQRHRASFDAWVIQETYERTQVAAAAQIK